jgi:hypothetical protein
VCRGDAHTRNSVGVLKYVLVDELGLVYSSVAQNLDSAGPITSDLLIYLESSLGFIPRRTEKGDPERYAVFYALCASLALIWLSVRVLRCRES